MADSPSKRSRLSGHPAPGKRSSAPQQALDALLAVPAGEAVRRAMWLDELDRRLQPALPQELAAHARLANVDGHRLMYLVDSPVWHARLRMASTELVDAARSFGLEVAEVVIRTSTGPLRPHATGKAGTPAWRKGMSAAAGQTLQAALASLGASVGAEAERDGACPDGPGGEPMPSRTGHPTGTGDAGS